MSEDREDSTQGAESEAIEALLAGGEPVDAGDEAAGLLLRLNRETLGLLGYEARAARLDPTRKARLLEAALAAEPRSAIAPKAVSLPPPAPLPFRVGPAAGGSSSWPFRIAATLAIVAFGLAGWLGWRIERGQSQEREMRALLAQLGERARAAEERAAAADRLRETVTLLTSSAVSACVLAPPAGAEGGVRGVMFVASDHQHWYLRLEGLPAAPEGKEYRVWFLVDGAPRSAGRALAGPDQTAEMGSDTMPAGTSAVLVSLETAGQALAEPSGPRVLYGDRMVEIV